MTEAGRGDSATLNPGSVGARLRAAREAIGMPLSEIASRTRVPLRHLEAIEASDYAALPSATYAVGFVRSYARLVGADEVKLAHDARIEVTSAVRAVPPYEPYEIADPKRVPSRTLVIVATGLLIAVLVLGILWFATTVFHGRADDQGAAAPVVAAVPAVTPTAAPARTANATGGQVRLTATGEVWMRVYDSANKTLYLGTLKPGASYDVPADAAAPMINVGRPDKLTVTLNGSTVAPLGTGERAIKDVPIGAAALAARGAGQPAPTPTASTTAAAVPPTFARANRADRSARGDRSRRRPRPSDLVKPATDPATARANERSPEQTPTATATPNP